MKKIIRTAALFCILTVLMLCGCETAGYTDKNLKTTNGEDGWICTFDSLNGEYTNGFNINSNTLRITSTVKGGHMNIVLSANGITDTYDGMDMDESIPVEKFGEGNIYIKFEAKDATDGRVRIIWESYEDEETPGNPQSE